MRAERRRDLLQKREGEKVNRTTPEKSKGAYSVHGGIGRVEHIALVHGRENGKGTPGGTSIETTACEGGGGERRCLQKTDHGELGRHRVLAEGRKRPEDLSGADARSGRY